MAKNHMSIAAASSVKDQFRENLRQYLAPKHSTTLEACISARKRLDDLGQS